MYLATIRRSLRAANLGFPKKYAHPKLEIVKDTTDRPWTDRPARLPWAPWAYKHDIMAATATSRGASCPKTPINLR